MSPKIPTNITALLKKGNSYYLSRNRSTKFFDLMQLHVLTTPQLYIFLILYFLINFTLFSSIYWLYLVQI